MRIGTYNVEWFDRLFDNYSDLIDDGSWSARRDVTKAEQTAALGHVFNAMDLDAVVVIEAPDSSRKRDGAVALENFAARFNLRTRKAVVGFENNTQQEIALLYDPDVVSAIHDPIGEPTGKKGSSKAPRLDGVFRIDVNTDAAPEMITWSKPPLEVALKTATGSTIRLIGVHAKSKAPHGVRNDAQAARMSIENRRKQLAQCIWLRQRVDTHLTAGDDLIVLGDFNDGPGLDEYEKLFGRSGVEIVLDEDHASACLTRTPTSHLVSGSAQCRPHRASNAATVRTCKRCLITSWCRRVCAILNLTGKSGTRLITLSAMKTGRCARRY